MSLTTLRWHLEDFNAEQGADAGADAGAEIPAAPAEEEEPTPADSWMEGYLHAIRHVAVPEPQLCPRDGWTLALQQLEERLQEAAEESAALVAGLLLKAVLAVFARQPDGDWQARLRQITDLIRPALLEAQPKLTVQAENGDVVVAATAIAGVGDVPVGDMPVGSASCDRACVSWRLGKAEYSVRAAVEQAVLALAPIVVDTISRDSSSGQEHTST
jgi:hypothetical protein